jgi:hypothetical protein
VQWVEQMVKQGIEASSIEGLAAHLGRKQALECVESNRLVGEFCWVTRLIAEYHDVRTYSSVERDTRSSRWGIMNPAFSLAHIFMRPCGKPV